MSSFISSITLQTKKPQIKEEGIENIGNGKKNKVTKTIVNTITTLIALFSLLIFLFVIC